MNKKIIVALLSLTTLSLTACGNVIDYEQNLDKYVYTLKFHNDYNVLQLTDIHWNYTSSTLSSKTYLEKLLKVVKDHAPGGKIDLIEITGDQFMLANTYHVETFINFFEKQAEEYGFMYTVIWGNHDRHGLYNPNWLSDQFKKAKHCIYIESNDNLYGRSNFVINLTEDGSKNTETVWQLANLDSGASFSETAISPFRDYDYIRDDQVDWWLKENERANNAPTIAYYHIPQQDNLQAWDEIHDPVHPAGYKHKFFKLEGFADNGNEAYYSKFIEKGRTANTLKAAFMGHAHNVDWTVDYNGVVIGLGVKTGTELYYAHIDVNDQTPEMVEGLASVGINENFDLIGASLVTIKDATDFELEHVYFNERANEDFVKWVKW